MTVYDRLRALHLPFLQTSNRQETTKYKAGTLLLNMYESAGESVQPIGDKIEFETTSADCLDKDVQLEEEVEEYMYSDRSDRKRYGVRH